MPRAGQVGGRHDHVRLFNPFAAWMGKPRESSGPYGARLSAIGCELGIGIDTTDGPHPKNAFSKLSVSTALRLASIDSCRLRW